MPPDTAVLHVCPLRLVPKVIADTGARSLISVINAHLMPPTPSAIPPERHLKLAMSDADRVREGEPHPQAAQIVQLIAFARTWDRTSPMVIHCFSGLNRSTAAAFIIACALAPSSSEILIAHRLRLASETAAPHRMMIGLADRELQRGGRMYAAIESIGHGMPAAEGKPFALMLTQS